MVLLFCICALRSRVLLEPKARVGRRFWAFRPPVSQCHSVRSCRLSRAAVLGPLLLPGAVSGCVVGTPQTWRHEPSPDPEPAPRPHEGRRQLPCSGLAAAPVRVATVAPHDVCRTWALRSGQDRTAVLGPGGQSGALTSAPLSV